MGFFFHWVTLSLKNTFRRRESVSLWSLTNLEVKYSTRKRFKESQWGCTASVAQVTQQPTVPQLLFACVSAHCNVTNKSHGKCVSFNHVYVWQYAIYIPSHFVFTSNYYLLLLTSGRILQKDAKCYLSHIILVKSAILFIIYKSKPHLRSHVVVLQVSQ